MAAFFVGREAIANQPQLPSPVRMMPRSRSHSLIIPEAQPTPESTAIAFTGQFRAQAPHSMQSSFAMMAAFFPSRTKT